jgi:hypothetical protein
MDGQDVAASRRGGAGPLSENAEYFPHSARELTQPDGSAGDITGRPAGSIGLAEGRGACTIVVEGGQINANNDSA